MNPRSLGQGQVLSQSADGRRHVNTAPPGSGDPTRACFVISVADRDLTSSVGADTAFNYLVASGGTDDWSDEDGKVAAYSPEGWTFISLEAGSLVWVADEATLLLWDGSSMLTIYP